MGFLKKIFSWIVKIIRKICEALGPLFPILVIALFVFAPYLGPWLTGMGLSTVGGAVTALGSVLSGVGTWGQLALGLGVSYLVAPEATGEMIEAVGELAGKVVDVAADVIGDAVGSIGGALFSSPVVWIGLGFLAWYLLKDNSTKVEMISPDGAARANEPSAFLDQELVK